MYDYFTPAYKAGGPIQSLDSMVKALGETFKFSIFCSNQDHDGTELNVQANTWQLYNQAQVLYASHGFLKVSKISKLIKEKQPALLYINGLYSWYFNVLPLLNSKSIRKIVSVRGMLHPGALSQKALKKKIYLALWKLSGLHKQCEFHATNQQERHFIEQVFGQKVKIWVAGNFPKILDYQDTPEKAKGALVMVSVALISPMKNHLLVLQALQNVTCVVLYNIYGPIKDEKYWEECKELMMTLPANVRVQYNGEVVPEKVSRALKNAHLFILPSESENFGHAIYEAMTSGKPIITSNNTPWNRLQDSKAGINVDLSKSEINKAISFFAAMDTEDLQVWSKSAREYALNAVNIDTIRDDYLQMFSPSMNI